MAGLVREIRVAIETGKVLRIVTNDLAADAQQIADLYKRRWAIELFFRWVKQTLKIGHFFGTAENAVRIQIVVARMIAFVLLRLAHDANRIVNAATSAATVGRSIALRLAHDANRIVNSPLAFARLIRANLLHRRPIARS